MKQPTALPALREQVGDLLVRLRGDVSRHEMARRLGIVRQGTMKLEQGIVSLARLEELEEHYGVRFALVALDPVTGDLVAASADQLGQV